MGTGQSYQTMQDDQEPDRLDRQVHYSAGADGGKFFATTGEHAEQWGELLNGGDGVTVETRIPDSLADQLFLRAGKLDGVGPAIYANGEQLEQINMLMDGIRVWP